MGRETETERGRVQVMGIRGRNLMCHLVGEMREVPGTMDLHRGGGVGEEQGPLLQVAGPLLLPGMRESIETAMTIATEETDMTGVIVEAEELTIMRGETGTAVIGMIEDITMTTEVMEEIEEGIDTTDRTVTAEITGRVRGVTEVITDHRVVRKKKEIRRLAPCQSLTGVERSLLLTGGSQVKG